MISVIIPMYNEEENVNGALDAVSEVLGKNYSEYEIIAVDDGSCDDTPALLDKRSSGDKRIRVLRHENNEGMGNALRTGFKVAKGDVIVTMDADLSYDPVYIPLLVRETEKADIVIGSQYMPDGSTENIPIHRLILSRMANKLVGFSLKENFNTITGVFRAYKKDVIDSLNLESEGTEINPEILVKANAMGYSIREVPVKLRGREKGRSKIRVKSAIISHLLFAFNERPMILFGIIGGIICTLGVMSGVYLFALYLKQELDPTRPLMTFMLLAVLSGIQILSFGFIATQVTMLRKEIYITQRDLKIIMSSLSYNSEKPENTRYDAAEDLGVKE